MMKPPEFAAKMAELWDRHRGDIEACHAHADDLMCLILRELGYEEGVDIFEDMDKWYA